MKTHKFTIVLISLLTLLLIPYALFSQERSNGQTSRGWYEFHRTVNDMRDLTVLDRVDIIFALQDSFETKLPVDYLWTSEQIDGLRSLILLGFTYEFSPAKIAGACVTLFDAYQLGAVHPEIIDFLDLLLTENISADMLTSLTRVASSLKELPDEITIQFQAEIVHHNWDIGQIRAATRCLKSASLKKLDLNQALVGTVIVLSQGTNPAMLDEELHKMLRALEEEKQRSQRLSRFTSIAGEFRNSYLSDNFLNSLIAEAIESDWAEGDFNLILNTVVQGAKNGLPYERLATSIIIRLSQEKGKSVNQVCNEEFQYFNRQIMSERQEKINRELAGHPKQKLQVDHERMGNSNANFDRMYEIIQSYLGTPYRWGGTSRSGVDCSGLTQNVFRQCGLYIPRTCRKQFRRGEQIQRSQMKFGDLVFFKTNYFGSPSHVGIYLGNSQFCHASSSRGVIISNLSKHYYQVRFLGTRRYR